MRFALIDQIVDMKAGESITAIKNLSLAEEYLADHFPGFPVMPGVLMLETLVQAGAWLIRHTENFEHSTVMLKQAGALKFNNFVSPGQTLTVNLTTHKWEDDGITFKAKGQIGDVSAVSARIILQRFNLRDKNPNMASADEFQIQKSKEMFQHIYKQD
ncbi:3-hydroxyacyl-[acyl-carrier-protein] dehydratase FabZ [Polystyrenella longa]|uniref:3-hydroxyacyl-[acyl-carrier-protein] dehydratase FabZ n=1 Tax=Polystyrenella longa TaxID=2528007 RepID=A0A518CGP7_9PLAN|nr:3-hydroxyacyl-ACP dehydratase FabZ family protein [Polystyrenella longa]QDU78402.1 3-hydroxyacyl-[acyl-carrier-protein] dehydratase FabZ [Polystyrenella longa]